MEKEKNSKVVFHSPGETARILATLDEKMRLLEQDGTAKPRWEATFQALFEDLADAVEFFEVGCSPMENLHAVSRFRPECNSHGWLVPRGITPRMWCDCCMQKKFSEKHDLIESNYSLPYSTELLMKDLEEMGIAKRVWGVEFRFFAGSRQESEALLEEGERFLLTVRNAIALRSKAEFSGWELPVGLKADLETPWTEWEGADFLYWNGLKEKRREGFRVLRDLPGNWKQDSKEIGQ